MSEPRSLATSKITQQPRPEDRECFFFCLINISAYLFCAFNSFYPKRVYVFLSIHKCKYIFGLDLHLQQDYFLFIDKIKKIWDAELL